MKKELSESEVMSKVSSMISFIKSQTKQDVVVAKNKKMFDINESDLEKVCNIIESCIQQNFIKSSVEVTSFFK